MRARQRHASADILLARRDLAPAASPAPPRRARGRSEPFKSYDRPREEGLGWHRVFCCAELRGRCLLSTFVQRSSTLAAWCNWLLHIPRCPFKGLPSPERCTGLRSEFSSSFSVLPKKQKLSCHIRQPDEIWGLRRLFPVLLRHLGKLGSRLFARTVLSPSILWWLSCLRSDRRLSLAMTG
ncbi:hypothetical protein GQ53DRAFT_89132 [Thozetella sp. PMI_491]|nr:hypothetical protein GQ53DRAFT_89132 [Thozetella sp. PMI_491]